MRIKRSVDRLPEHLKAFVATQVDGLYTPIDQAGWRYIMRVSTEFFKQHAHKKYLDGLVETGIETDRIPQIDEMDICLNQFGWGAIPVSGFIPPGVFMELMSLGILPIAADMRKLENLDYTPSPDIVHESAGHAPIIADPEYAKFLHECGEIARKCILTKRDMDLYDAILDLSNMKEDPRSTPERIAQAEVNLKKATEANKVASEAAKFGRMIWWTVEYGLVGDLNKPEIYGAGLLSSVGESFHCLTDAVKKIPFSLDCINYSYDITEPQPQLFVTPDFETLTKVAREFAQTLAYKRGGVFGLEAAKDAAYVTTAQLDSEIQISGILTNYYLDSKGQPAYLQYQGPCQLALGDSELAGQGIARHAHGFGTPVGKTKGSGMSALQVGQKSSLEFESGVKVTGVIQKIVNHPKTQKPVYVTWNECKVTGSFGGGAEIVLFDPSWGEFDMAVGESVTSVFGGAADRPKYKIENADKYQARVPVSNSLQQSSKLNELYLKVRKIREQKSATADEELEQIAKSLDKDFSADWLLRLEILELSKGKSLETKMRKQLDALKAAGPKNVSELIERGLKLI